MMAALLFYAVLVWFVASKRLETPMPPAFALPVHALLAFVALAGGLLFVRASFSDAALSKAPAAVPPTGIPALSPRDRQLFAVLAYGRTRLIIAWAFFEAIGVYGVICVFLGHPAERMLPFVAVALAAMALHRPRLMELVERADTLLPRT